MKKVFQRTADKVVSQQTHSISSQKIPLSQRTYAKVSAFILTIIMMALVFASVIGAYMMVDFELYTKSKEELRYERFSVLARSIAYDAVDSVMNGNESAFIRSCKRQNIAGISVDGTGKNPFQWHYGSTEGKDAVQQCKETFFWDGENVIWDYYTHDEPLDPIEVTVYIPDHLTIRDGFYFIDQILSIGYALRYWVYVIGITALILGIFTFVFLMISSGHRNGDPNVQPGWGTRVPADLLLAGYLLLFFLLIQFADETTYMADTFWSVIACISAGIAIAVMTLGLCMSIAVRLKLGKWWKNSILYYALCVAWKILRKLGKLLRYFMLLVCKIPLVWKTAVIYLGISFVEFFFIMAFYWDIDALVVLWMFGKMILFPVIIYLALVLRKLQKGGKAIAEGDLSYQINTKHMLPSFKKHGENLNQIGEGMTLAVEQRLKSERMKTELITNVSHDIKTPLTSIINYSDLIEKEPCDNPKITEYADVLHRQSDRLKRLIEDLVEASKASTGNLEVHLAPCEVGVMMSQTVGEYEQRLSDSQLQILTNQPQNAVKIMADGRRLWRVFDNLMNNICKYGQPGTRVYLTLEETATEAIISFKNTSREPLNLTAEELMERFVRGDSARNSEGNGLGLSIAKSLTELQNGSMEVTVDGDLFKVILRFPKIH